MQHLQFIEVIIAWTMDYLTIFSLSSFDADAILLFCSSIPWVNFFIAPLQSSSTHFNLCQPITRILSSKQIQQCLLAYDGQRRNSLASAKCTSRVFMMSHPLPRPNQENITARILVNRNSCALVSVKISGTSFAETLIL